MYYGGNKFILHKIMPPDPSELRPKVKANLPNGPFVPLPRIQSPSSYNNCCEDGCVSPSSLKNSGNQLLKEIIFGGSPAVEHVIDGKNEAIARHKAQSKKRGKTPSELQAIGKDMELSDYTETIDKWVVEQEKYFDKLYRSVSTPSGGIVGGVNFNLKFINKVQTYGDMDIKQKDSWNSAFPEDTMPYPSKEKPYFLYHGQVMDAATLGNVVYAYVGAKYYTDEMLRFGGGAVQTKRRDMGDLPYIFALDDYGEAPDDVEAVDLGLKWRKEGFPDEK